MSTSLSRERKPRYLSERELHEELLHIDDICQDHQMQRHLSIIKDATDKALVDLKLLNMELARTQTDVALCRRILRSALKHVTDADKEAKAATETETDDQDRHRARGQIHELKRAEAASRPWRPEGPHAS